MVPHSKCFFEKNIHNNKTLRTQTQKHTHDGHAEQVGRFHAVEQQGRLQGDQGADSYDRVSPNYNTQDGRSVACRLASKEQQTQAESITANRIGRWRKKNEVDPAHQRPIRAGKRPQVVLIGLRSPLYCTRTQPPNEDNADCRSMSP